MFIVALYGNHSDNSFMFQGISHSRNDFKLRREVISDKAMELVQKQLSAICLDFQSMVDIFFVEVMPVLLLLWHT